MRKQKEDKKKTEHRIFLKTNLERELRDGIVGMTEGKRDKYVNEKEAKLVKE